MNTSYQFDHFEHEHMKSEIKRLTANVDSHSEALTRLFLENGLYGAKNVLDVGCGTGAMIDLFSKFLPEAFFRGIDNSEKILETAKSKFSSSEKIHFFRGNANSLPFSENTFDFVFTRLVLMHNPNPNEIVKEMVRVCKPGGIVCAVEIDDGTQVFHPFGRELSKLVNAHIEYSCINGTDRTIGRKLYSYFVSESLNDVKVITQTSDYFMKNREAEEMPILIKFALGNDEGKRLVNAGLISEKERIEFINNIIPTFCHNPHRYESCSFMYSFGRKH
ncbi:class I SAM-dependent methyltransferase [Paenibacillus harenae]|uniref:Ubiquinone/menaquinone biosynthesis C-methylase UbiE n=1 Tax=Paenibacillus harenae TaxID=306543 RepID=A0ABT9UAS0_PAEHA|nr:methyltransferase domain-containing protein [Paenibacillus harenae]MDQ0116747.1 ubiquinone/menaquinone biosynthesis C-methylase UbiE [Paenibacillus harenae]